MSNVTLNSLQRSLKSANRSGQGGGDAAASRPGGPQLCGDIDMRIGRDGTWFYHGSPIRRKPMVKLFASVLHHDAAGDYWLETPVEKCRIRVDDAPFTAVEMWVDGAGKDQTLSFRTNIDEIVMAGPDNPIRLSIDPGSGEPSPYVLVRGGLEALIARPVYYDLVDLGEEAVIDGAATFGVWSGGVYFPFGPVEEE